jgi:hypothetical protein
LRGEGFLVYWTAGCAMGASSDAWRAACLGGYRPLFKRSV